MQLDRVFADVDGEQLKAVLVAIASQIEGLGPSDIDQFCLEVAALKPDEDALMEPDISFRDQPLPFAVEVFKEAQGSLEVLFLLPRVLTPLVRNAAISIVGTSAVRSIVAE